MKLATSLFEPAPVVHTQARWLHLCTNSPQLHSRRFNLERKLFDGVAKCVRCSLFEWLLERGRGLDVLPGCGRLWLAVILLPSQVFGAGAAQQGATQNRQTGRRPSHKQGGAKFIPAHGDLLYFQIYRNCYYWDTLVQTKGHANALLAFSTEFKLDRL